MTLFYILAAILLFGILITVHEAGHFFAARLMKIPVREFAIGFGPSLLKWKRKKHDTQFFLRAIPLGGYCAFYGEDDTTGEFKDDPRYFGNFSVPKRLATILMGPLMNLLLAVLVAILLYSISGIPVPDGPYVTYVQSVSADSAAQLGGMLPGDIILSVDGQPVSDNLSELLNQGERGAARQFVVRREVDGSEQEEELTITPLYDPVQQRSLIGIMMSIAQPVKMVRGTIGQVLEQSVQTSWQAGKMVVTAIVNLFTRGEGAGEVAGVVGITKMIVDEIQRSQLEGYLYLMVVISINLGLMNLLIIPGLDGSRIVFLLLEAVRGKPIAKEGYVHAAGMILLFALMIFITFRDVIRLF
ncbi:MAG TPA: site-2 protease family protein [Clostridia bacterium]|nr:site-2 protease family protein [Clostridia bacterium]